MYRFIQELQQRNGLLFGYGSLCLLGCFVCIVLMQTTTLQVNNTNAFLKPAKFFGSVWLFSWTMGWLLTELNRSSTETHYTYAVLVVMTIELVIITWQAANGRLSHFNISTPFYSILFSLMGVAISILVLYTAYIGYLFFQVPAVGTRAAYLWGIRLGIVLFVVFSFQGGMMGARLAHTVGAPDGSAGLPIINWSKQYGDLRVAHFFGIHALQLLPIAGYLLGKQMYSLIALAIVYATWVSYTLVKAMKGLAFW